MEPPAATVFVVDEDPGLRKSLCVVLEASGFIAQGCASAEEYLENDASATRCLVLELRLGAMSGLHLMEHLRSQQVEIPIIIVSGHGTVAAAVSAMKLGAVEFLEKPVNHHDLVKSVNLAIAGDAVRRSRETDTRTIRKRLVSLSPRERELLRFLIDGKSSKQIAVELSRSQKTIENHRTSLLAKMQVQNVAALVALTVYANPSIPPPVRAAGAVAV